MKTLDVQFPGAKYPITIGAGILEAALREVVGRHGRELVLVVTNETLANLYPGRIEAALEGLPLRVEQCVLPDGERYKTLATLGTIIDRLMRSLVPRRPRDRRARGRRRSSKRPSPSRSTA